jgi:hypothetical protein
MSDQSSSAPVGDIVAFVVDPNHERFGERASVGVHDWRESGDVWVRFADGTSAPFHDGMMSDDAYLPGVWIVRTELGEATRMREGLPRVRDELAAAIGEVAEGASRRATRAESLAAKRTFKEILFRIQSGSAEQSASGTAD